MDSFSTSRTRIPVLTRRAIAVAFLMCILVGIISLSAWYALASQPPDEFPVNTDITIQNGMNLKDIAKHLYESKVIDSPVIFSAILSQKYANKSVKAGIYQFSTPLTIEGVADALVEGSYKTPLQRVTFPEGFRVANFKTYTGDKATLAQELSPEQYEGFLFPDTYFIDNGTTQSELVTLMQQNYETHLAPLRERIQASGHTEKEIITLASIIEREANDETSMHMVSGVLHNRLNIDMPIQTDAVFDYLLGKTSAELTEDDLSIDSPYNTYTRRGLPPTPIGNPGMVAIEAALEPTKHDYLYYLSDEDGHFYYAKTFEQHKQNKARYLR